MRQPTTEQQARLAEQQEHPAEPKAKALSLKNILCTLLLYVLVIVVTTILFRQVLMLNLIPSSSMENTLQTGSFVVANRLDCDDIQRYDIMVFRSPERDDEDSYYIKRVIGLPGETITVAGGKVYAGLELLDDSFLPEAMEPGGDGVYHVPEGCYFMLGDNRNNSADSRYWGNSEKYRHQYVPQEDMVAKAAVSIWPPRQIGSLHYEESEAHQAQALQAENETRGDCSSCGVTACVVEGGEAGHCEMDGDEVKWVVDGNVRYCLACGRKTTPDGRQILRAEGPREDCPTCGGTACVIQGEETGHYESSEQGPVWVVDGTVHYCLFCGQESLA